MADVELPLEAFGPDDLVPLCVKSSERTATWVPVQAAYTPMWWQWILIHSAPAWSWPAARRPEWPTIRVPIRADIWRQYLRSQRIGRRAAMLGALGLVLAGVSHLPVGVALAVAVMCLGVGLMAAGRWINFVGVRLTSHGTVVLTRVHPSAAAAFRSHNLEAIESVEIKRRIVEGPGGSP